MPQFAQLHFVAGLEAMEQPVVAERPSPEKVASFARGLSKGPHVNLHMDLREEGVPGVFLQYYPHTRTAGMLLFVTDAARMVAAGAVLSGVSDEDDDRALQVVTDTNRLPTGWTDRVRRAARPCLALFHYRPLREKPDILVAAASLAEALFTHVGANTPAGPLGTPDSGPLAGSIETIVIDREGKISSRGEWQLGVAHGMPPLWEHTKTLHRLLSTEKVFDESLPGPGATGFDVSWHRMALDAGLAVIRWAGKSIDVLALGGVDDLADRSAVEALQKTHGLDAGTVEQIVSTPRPLLVSVGEAPVAAVECLGLDLGLRCFALAFLMWQDERGQRG